MKGPKNYNSIVFSNFKIPEDSLNILARQFADFENIKSICFETNSLLPSSVKAIGDIIRMGHLKELKIVENSICDYGIAEVAAALANNNTILSLTFSCIGLRDSDDVTVLMNSLSAGSAIESLDISNNGIGSKGAE